ncbi:hypothetical protein BOTBODRAFT_71084 [Botryobasidium botryosum FD-172 SS1]|uniref:BRO domain-containing protein 1 n=1 Tax=Botryobasidium botryosum (strain FD-172 SS1) TaxID=930990 RepID=A0A067LSG5_BOTB1|nr:hypothetical protein BOTBODRAFT_71084 [Botryobasidium botryosum FD-172 SS1]
MSQQSPMISIPKKKTDEVDWTTPIRSIIAGSYGESPDNYAAECASLQRCRQDAVRGAGSDVTARDLLYKYFGQLELLELRFSEIRVTFPWYDAFTFKLTTQTSVAFEKASVIFQIAATHSALALSQNRSDPEGLKRAFHYFRTSAGMLTYINDNFLHAPSTDLSREVVKFLVGLMLAQASEVFFEKLIEERKGSALVAKVAAQAAFLYSGINEDVKEFQGKGIFDRNWVLLIGIKVKYFQSLSQYHRALADAAAGQHGDALTRFTVAETLAKEAQRLAASFGPSFVLTQSPNLPADTGTAIQEITKSHLTVCSEKRTEAKRDNDLIYNAVLPSEATLPVIDKLAVATPIPIQDVYGAPDVQRVIGPDLFARLIPLSVHESASVYSEEKAKLARAEVEKAEAADGALRAGLNSLGLPGGLSKWKELVAGEESVELPREIEGLVEDVESGDGVPGVEKMRAELEKYKSAVGAELDAIKRELDAESLECEAMRVKYEHLWTQQPSAALTRSFRQDLKSHGDAFNSASSSDSQISALWASVMPDLTLLLSGTDALERFFAEQVIHGTGRAQEPSLLDFEQTEDEQGGILKEIGRRVTEIDERIGKLNKIKRERNEVLKDLKEKIQSDDVSHLLLLNRRTPTVEPSLFAQELEKFRPYQTRLAATIHHQEATLEEVVVSWKKLQSGKGKSLVKKAEGRDKRRTECIGRLLRAKEGWFEVREALRKGIKFYRELSETASSLHREVSRFVTTRGTERQSLVSQAETSQRLSATPAPPPKLPAKEPPQMPPPPPRGSGLESSFGGLNISSPSPASPWSAQRTNAPPLPPPPPSAPMSPAQTRPQYPPTPPAMAPSYPPPPPQQHRMSLPPPPPPPQTGYGGSPSPNPPTQSYYPPPPASQNQAYPTSPPPATDPYADLFNLPGLSSHFSTAQPTPPPPPPPQQQTWQSQPQRHSSYPAPPAQQQQQQSYHSPQGYNYGQSPAPPPPPPPQQSPYPPPPPQHQNSYSQQQQYSNTGPYPPPPPPHGQQHHQYQQQQQQPYQNYQQQQQQPPPPPPQQYGQYGPGQGGYGYGR